MNTSVLEEVGLTESEIKIYLALLKLGISKSGEIIRETGMMNSGVYRCLDSLLAKGLISFVIKNNVKHFQASKPETLLSFIDDKRTKIIELIPQLTKRYEPVEQEARMYEGYKAITTAYEECNEELSSGEEILFFSIGGEDLSDKNIQTFFMNLAAKRKEKKLMMRGIASLNTREVFKKYPAKVIMRYTDLKLPTGLSIYKTKVVLVSWKDKPTAIIIKSKNIVEGYRQFFEEMWKIAKK